MTDRKGRSFILTSTLAGVALGPIAAFVVVMFIEIAEHPYHTGRYSWVVLGVLVVLSTLGGILCRVAARRQGSGSSAGRQRLEWAGWFSTSRASADVSSSNPRAPDDPRTGLLDALLGPAGCCPRYLSFLDADPRAYSPMVSRSDGCHHDYQRDSVRSPDVEVLSEARASHRDLSHGRGSAGQTWRLSGRSDCNRGVRSPDHSGDVRHHGHGHWLGAACYRMPRVRGERMAMAMAENTHDSVGPCLCRRGLDGLACYSVVTCGPREEARSNEPRREA